ncbi:MAG: hypothetical protein WC438_02830 [Candidatus Pacearchaeota archaeon]
MFSLPILIVVCIGLVLWMRDFTFKGALRAILFAFFGVFTIWGWLIFASKMVDAHIYEKITFEQLGIFPFFEVIYFLASITAIAFIYAIKSKDRTVSIVNAIWVQFTGFIISLLILAVMLGTLVLAKCTIGDAATPLPNIILFGTLILEIFSFTISLIMSFVANS